LQAIASDDFQPDDPAKIVEYGLAEGNQDRVKVEIKITAKGQPDRTEIAFIGKKVDKAPNKLYVKVPGIPGIIVATAQNADAILGVLADPSPMRNRNLFPSEMNRGQISAVDITRDGKTAKLRQPAMSFGRWQLFGEVGDPQDANNPVVTKLIDVLTQQRTVKDFPAPNDANFTGPELKAEVKLWTEMEMPDPKADAKTEPRTKGNPITFQFGKVNRDGAGKVTEIYVRRIMPSGAKSDFILPGEVKTSSAPSFSPQFPTPAASGIDTDVLATISKTRLDLLDPKLKDFSASSAAKLAVANGPTTLEMNFDEKSEPPYFWVRPSASSARSRR